jgi:hypothetical protein
MPRGLLRISCSWALPFAASIIGAAPSAAQLRLEFTPLMALYAPACPVPVGALSSGLLPSTSYRQEMGPGVGGRLTEVLRQGTALELSLVYARSSVDDGTVDRQTSVRLWSVRLLLDLGSRRPRASSLYALLGGTIAIHQGGEYSLAQEYRAVSPGVVAGLGLRRRVARFLTLRTEFEDYVYWLRGGSTRLQNDFLISVGPSFVIEAL